MFISTTLCLSLSPTTSTIIYILTFLTRVSAFFILPPPVIAVRIPPRVHFRCNTQKDIRYLHHFQCVSIYGFWIRYLSLSLTVGKNRFQIALSQNIKEAMSWGAVNFTEFSTGTLYSVLHCGRMEAKYGKPCVSHFVRTLRQYNSSIPTAPLQSHNNGRGHGCYKRPHYTVLPFLQGKYCDIQSPYVTDWCVIRAVSLYYRTITSHEIHWACFWRCSDILFRGLALTNYGTLHSVVSWVYTYQLHSSKIYVSATEAFLRHDICCHVGGSLPTYLAGVQTSFHMITIFIDLKKPRL